jgi:aminoglycoside phosphotransferase family enzyme/predicted kinase
VPMPNNESFSRRELIEFLLQPSSYPHKTPEVRHVQTHASDIFIAPPYVYKVKKPVDLGFLDFSTLDKRKHFCKIEVELNRRLCRGVYLGVEEITVKDGRLSFGGAGAAVDYAVKMRKLPERNFLINLLGMGKITEAELRRLSQKLVDFYVKQPPRHEVLAYGRSERIKINIEENLVLSEKFTGKTISREAYESLKYYNEIFFRDKADIFGRRIEGNFIKDCHGDLHLDHINIGPKDICIYDCIEFNERFRYIDTASDIAFLAMDLDYNEYPGFARFIVNEISVSMNDSSIYDVMDFYKCYRAFVRGKVDSIKAYEPEVPDEEKRASRERAKKYFRLALRYALFGSRPIVIVIFGMIGTGKSTLASLLGEELSCRIVSSDAVRKEITGTPSGEKRYDRWGGGIYTEDITRTTYGEIISRALGRLDEEGFVILDASFSKRRWRDTLMRRAMEKKAGVLFIRTTAPEDVIVERLVRREREVTSVSDARVSILESFISEWEEPEEIKGRFYFETDTNREERDALRRVLMSIISVGAGREGV